jgi:uncharacterized membrane protein
MAEELKKPVTGGSNDVEENKVIAAIGYLGILCLVPLLGKKDSPFAQFHGKQGLVLFIAGMLIGVVAIIPFLGWLIAMVGGIAIFIFWIMGVMNALGGKMVPLPIIGQYADKINL